MLHRLSSAAALALVGIGLINSMEVGTEADLARMYLCDYGADCSMCVFSRLDAELKELPTMFRVFLG